MKIPELGLELDEGTLGGKYTTLVRHTPNRIVAFPAAAQFPSCVSGAVADCCRRVYWET